MPNYLTPGVYFEKRKLPETPLPIRTDVAGFVGLAERGPIHTPQRLATWRQYQEVFGGFLSYAHLAYAVRAFFENGGSACWVVRVADADTARAASVDIPAQGGGVAYSVKAISPGAWGDELSISVQAASLAASQNVVKGLSDNRLLAVESISGFEKGSWVRLTQTPGRTIVLRRIEEVDVALGVLSFDKELTDTELQRNNKRSPISVESLEFTLFVREADGVRERFANLAPDPKHSRFAVNIVNDADTGSRLIQLVQEDDGAIPQLPWRGALAGGANGLRTMNIFDYIGIPGGQAYGLAKLEQIDEVSLLVMPDLTVRPQSPRRIQRAPHRQIDKCALDTPTSLTDLVGKVIDAETGNPLADVEVRDGRQRFLFGTELRPQTNLDSDNILDILRQAFEKNGKPLSQNAVISIEKDGERWLITDWDNRKIFALRKKGDKVNVYLQSVMTGGDGRFTLEDLLPGQVELVLYLKGYEEKKVPPVNVSASTSGEQELAETIKLTPLDLPPALSNADIYHGQAKMVEQCEHLCDRFALIDPPLDAKGKQLNLSELQAWRARFDTAFAALYYPWLVIRDPLQPDAPQGRLAPPSGHISGVYAATDLAEGVFRPPSNRELVWVEDVGAAVDDAVHGVLNPKGINAIRAFPGRGIRVYGARTMSSDTAWHFVNVRRLMSMLKEAMQNSLQWAVFEPNDTQLWFGLRLAIISLLDKLWRRGAFAGNTADEAYQVRCDATTTPPEVQAEGQVIAEVRVAPTVPYEFIVLRLGLTADELKISEV